MTINSYTKVQEELRRLSSLLQDVGEVANVLRDVNMDRLATRLETADVVGQSIIETVLHEMHQGSVQDLQHSQNIAFGLLGALVNGAITPPLKEEPQSSEVVQQAEATRIPTNMVKKEEPTKAKAKKSKNLYEAWSCDWTEHERGWGCRPDGVSYSLSKEKLQAHIDYVLSRMPKDRVPDEYTSPGAVQPVWVNEALKKEIENTDNGIFTTNRTDHAGDRGRRRLEA